MLTIPPTPERSARLLGLLTPFVIVIGVVVLLLLPNLIMHMGPTGSLSPMIDHHAASQSAAAGMAAPVVR